MTVETDTGWARTIDTSVPAVVFKLTRDRLQHGTLGLARTLGRLGVRVELATADEGGPPTRSRYVAHHTLTPPAGGSSSGERVLDVIGGIARRLGTAPVLIAADDVASRFVADHLDAVRARFLVPAQAPGLPQALSNKAELHRLCLAHDVPSPEARFATNRSELHAAAEALGYPVVLKAMDPDVLQRQARPRSVAIATSPSELGAILDAHDDAARTNYMVQEFIPGGAESIWMFNGYFDVNGGAPIGIVGQKIRQAPPRTGATTLGVVVRNDVVRDLATRFLGELGYRGIVDLGFRFDARDGRYKLLDVNPRVGSTFRLFVSGNGLDVVRAMYLDLTGQPIPRPTPRNRRRWLVEDLDVATSLKLARRRELGLREYLTSLRGVQETAWLARDDLAPAARLVVETARTLGRRVVSASAGRFGGARTRRSTGLAQDGDGRSTPPS